jgi:hypothetical protein
MRVFAVPIEHALDRAVQCPHDADPGEHRRTSAHRHQIKACIAACHSGASCSALGSFVM